MIESNEQLGKVFAFTIELMNAHTEGKFMDIDKFRRIFKMGADDVATKKYQTINKENDVGFVLLRSFNDNKNTNMPRLKSINLAW